MNIPAEPDGFRALCERLGLAIMLGQKVQLSLACYYATFMQVNSGWTIDQAKAKMETHLSEPVGKVVADIKRDALLHEDLWSQVVQFKNCRNWLVHDFDEEATPFLVKGERIAHYTNEMERIAQFAQVIMVALDEVGGNLCRV